MNIVRMASVSLFSILVVGCASQRDGYVILPLPVDQIKLGNIVNNDEDFAEVIEDCIKGATKTQNAADEVT